MRQDRTSPAVNPRSLVLLILSAVAALGIWLLPLDDLKFWTFDYLLFLSVLLGLPVVLVLRRGRWLRVLVILFALAYFGFLQAACPRLPGAIELLLLHLFDDKPILMHGIKIAVVAGLALLFGRYYCGWVCPKGVIQEYVYNPRLKWQVPPRLDRVLKYGKYVTLVLLVGAPLLFHYRLMREFGPFKVIFNLEGETYLIVILAVVLTASIFIERAFCRYLCPEGGLLALLNVLSPYKIRVAEGACTSCRRCEKICPTGAFEARKKQVARVRHSECILCLECVSVCRQGAVYYGLPPGIAPVRVSCAATTTDDPAPPRRPPGEDEESQP